MTTQDIFITFAPAIALIAIMLAGFGMQHFSDIKKR